MKRISCVFLLVGLALAEEKPDPKAEWPAKRDALFRKTAAAHMQLATFCRQKKIHEPAWRESKRAALLDPSNAEAQKAVGKKLENGAWVADPKAEIKKRNEGVPSTFAAPMAEYDKKRTAMGEKTAKEYETLALWAAKVGLEAESKALWKDLILWYAPDHEKAHTALGHAKDGGWWVSKRDADNRAAAQKLIAGSDEGKDIAEKTDLENATGWALVRRRSKHFFLLGMYSDNDMKELAKVAEATRSQFLEIVGLGADELAFEIRGIYVKSHDHYKQYVGIQPGMNEQKRREYEAYAQSPFYDAPLRWVVSERDSGLLFLKDSTVHNVSHFMLYNHLAGAPRVPAWLTEGLAFWQSDRLLKTAQSYCASLETGDGGKDLKEVLGWRANIRQAIRDGTDPEPREVLDVGYNSLNGLKALKAWSYVDFLVTGRNDAFRGFLSDIMGGTSQEESLNARLEVKGYAEMDELWETWVDENY